MGVTVCLRCCEAVTLLTVCCGHTAAACAIVGWGECLGCLTGCESRGLLYPELCQTCDQCLADGMFSTSWDESCSST